MSWIDDVVNDLNAVIDNREVATTVSTAAVLGLCGVLYRLLDRFLIHRRVVSVTPVFDQVVNKGEKQNLTIRVPGRPSTGSQETYIVESFVILRFANAGTEKISFDAPDGDRFRVMFPNRWVRVIKVREPEELEADAGRASLSRGRLDELRTEITSQSCGLRDENGGMLDKSVLVLPKTVSLERKEAFQLAVFLSGKVDKIPEGEPKLEVRGELAQGKFVFRTHAWWHRLWPAAVPLALVAALAVSFGVGALTAHRALTPAASCAGDQPITIEGSTAFAHVAAEAAADYRQLCPAAEITVKADGSDAALADHHGGVDQNTILMVDESSQSAPPAAKASPVGMVIFAVVANAGDVPAGVNGFADYAAESRESEPNGGYTGPDLKQVYQAASSGGSGTHYVAVGRPSNSGSAAAFDQLTGLPAGLLEDAAGCPSLSSTATGLSATASTTGLCDVGTTQEMLEFVDDNPNAIGFAEIDGLSEYPNLVALTVGGYQPDRAAVNAGNYHFTVPEFLYSAQNPSAQVASFLAFLQSPAESAQLANLDAGFIPCDQLSATLADECTVGSASAAG